MTREELFDAWAPAGGPWSDWAKPVLFAHVEGDRITYPAETLFFL